MEGGGNVDVIVSAELQNRLDQVERQLASVEAGMLQASTETLSYIERFKLLEATDKRHEDDLRELKDATRGMKIQFDQVVAKIDMLEMKLFQWMQQLQKDSSKERQTSQKDWMRFLQIVLGGTIFLIVAYIFSTNFKG